MRATATTLALLVLVAVGCGDGDDASPERPAAREKSAPTGKPSRSVNIVITCAARTGQDTGSEGAPVPGFVACLKEMDAPLDVIAAWEGR